ncbi:MAG: hypothetical protein Q7J07_05375, partial [Pelolinea sp.]|nr:hypothetical protein [Pelolinea sp.]
MKINFFLMTAILLFSISCASSEAIPTQNNTDILTEFPSETALATTGEISGTLLQLPTPIIGTVALDFSERPCSAAWSNNGEYLPCPGDLEDIKGGYANRFEQVVIEGNIHIDQPGLLTIPAQKGSGYYAIFGKYPPFTVQSGDHFQAVLACADSHPDCDVNFSLEYTNPDNTIQQVAGAKWNKIFDPENSYIYANVNLDTLAGKTIQ